MTIAGAPDHRSEREIEAYLARLRRALRGISDDEVREIIAELRSHILDKAGASGEVTAAAVGATLAGMGNPEELASQYLTDNLLARAEVSDHRSGSCAARFAGQVSALPAFLFYSAPPSAIFSERFLFLWRWRNFSIREPRDCGLIRTATGRSRSHFDSDLEVCRSADTTCWAGGSCRSAGSQVSQWCY